MRLHFGYGHSYRWLAAVSPRLRYIFRGMAYARYTPKRNLTTTLLVALALWIAVLIIFLPVVG